jgi:hypothetical protein
VKPLKGENDMPKLYAYQMVGDGLVLLTPINAEHPDHGLPGGGEHPDQGLPGGVGGGRPSHPISGRWPGRVDPGYGVGVGGIPDNSLPSTPPPTLMPGWTLLLVRGPDGKWKYATLAPSSPPPRPLPEPIPPGGAPDQGLPPTAAPKT